MKAISTNGLYRTLVMALLTVSAFASIMIVLLALVSVSPAYAVDIQLMYRLYNPNSGEHFYTASIEERDAVRDAGWDYEGKGWSAPAASSTPVYRLYSGTDHHYTTSAVEREHLITVGWNDEGIGWYSDDGHGVSLYRQFNPNVDPYAETNNSGSHNYTTSRGEHDSLVSVGWRDEGVGWYGVDITAPGVGVVIPTTYDSSRSSIDSFESPWRISATGPGHPRGKYTEWYLFDRDTNTRWFYTGDDEGIGELVEIDVDRGSHVKGLAIWNAGSHYLQKNPGDNISGTYDAYGRLKQADVYANSNYVATYTFAERDLDARVLTFPVAVTSDVLTIEIKDVYPATLSSSCTLREIAYF